MKMRRVLTLCFCLVLGWVVPLQAGVQTLNLTLGPAQFGPNEIAFDITAEFLDDDLLSTDFLSSIDLSLAGSILPLGFDFTNFSLRNLTAGIGGAGDFSSNGLGTLTLDDNLLTANSSALLLGQLVLDSTLLVAGDYTVNFDDANTDAFVVGGKQGLMVVDNNDVISSNSSDFSISSTTVPEPASLAVFAIGALGLLVLHGNARRKGFLI